MKTLATISALLAFCALSLSLHAQDYAPAPVQTPPPPDNNGYGAPQDQGPPPSDQQNGPDQGGPGPQGGPDQGSPDQGASFQTFYDNLAQQGTWIQSSDYGYVWQPGVNDASWAPYTDGHWVYTDAGWTWASDEPWGWATYHYGRWVNLDGTGWCWVPGYTWAPAWVSWRYGDGYCGWAPLPPESFVGIDYGGDGIQISAIFHIGSDCDSYYGIGAGCYRFVPTIYLGYSNYHGHYANPYNNYALINRTSNVTNLNFNRDGGNGGRGNFNHVNVGGPPLAQVNAVAQSPVQHVTLTGAARPGASGRVTNNSLALFAPRVAPGATAQPSHVNGSVGRVGVNRGLDVTKPLAVTRNISGPAPTPSQIQAAQLAQFSAPPHAKVLTASTQVNPALQAPLTTLKPIAATSQVRAQGGAVNAPVNQGFAQQSHAVGNAASNTQGNPFYQATHPAQGPSANNAIVHSPSPSVSQQQAETPSAIVHQNETSAPQNNTFHPQQRANPETTTHQGENNAAQNNPFYQRQQAPAATATPAHTQAPASQPQAAPTVVHHSESNNTPQKDQAAQQQAQPSSTQQSQGFPAPSNNQGGGGYPGGQGGNGGYHHQH